MNLFPLKSLSRNSYLSGKSIPFERDLPPISVSASFIKVLVMTLTDEGDTFSGYYRQMQDLMAELSSELSGKVGGPCCWADVWDAAVSLEDPQFNQLYETLGIRSMDQRFEQRRRSETMRISNIVRITLG
jgi:hypothetical protein